MCTARDRLSVMMATASLLILKGSGICFRSLATTLLGSSMKACGAWRRCEVDMGLNSAWADTEPATSPAVMWRALTLSTLFTSH